MGPRPTLEPANLYLQKPALKSTRKSMTHSVRECSLRRALVRPEKQMEDAAAAQMAKVAKASGFHSQPANADRYRLPRSTGMLQQSANGAALPFTMQRP